MKKINSFFIKLASKARLLESGIGTALGAGAGFASGLGKIKNK